MNATMIVRIAKLVAVLGFFLPWAVVSCAGVQIATATGLEIAMGQMNVLDPNTGQAQRQTGESNIWIVLSAAAIAVGLVITFIANNAAGLRNAGIAAVAALVLSFAGMMIFKDVPKRAAAAQQSSSSSTQQLDAAALAAIQVTEQAGYWLTILALAAAAGVGIFGLPRGAGSAASSRSDGQ